jgi:molybdopterin-guanine dinucleotide biosynthesis protein A
VPRVDRQAESVCALYARTLASRIEALLDADERSIKALLAATNVRYVGHDELLAVDPELRSFRNLNTPEDYQAWVRTQRASC